MYNNHVYFGIWYNIPKPINPSPTLVMRHASYAGSGSSPLRLRSNASLPVMVFIEGGGFLVP